jgi:hypothetical protein
LVNNSKPLQNNILNFFKLFPQLSLAFSMIRSTANVPKAPFPTNKRKIIEEAINPS